MPACVGVLACLQDVWKQGCISRCHVALDVLNQDEGRCGAGVCSQLLGKGEMKVGGCVLSTVTLASH